ncbi:MAG: hypothetical protein HYV97_16865 [Bdellovibrio sp.]|nr:hypothetical protein [Bdellovibrio sp.]
MVTWILLPRFRANFALLLIFLVGQVQAEIVLEDRAFVRIGDQVFFEKRFLSEIPKLQIIRCYFEHSYLLSMDQILPERYTESLSTIKNWPRMRGVERDVFNLLIINKLDRHFRETGIYHIDRAERTRLLNNKPQLSKDCLRKIKTTPLSEFQQNLIAMEYSLRDRFSLGQLPSIQKPSAGTGAGENEQLASAEKFMRQYIANIYFQYGHFIFHYAP